MEMLSNQNSTMRAEADLDSDDSIFEIDFPEDMGEKLESRVDGINGYQWWDITLSSVYNLDSKINPKVMGNNTYFASGGRFNNGQGWYMGLQQKGDGVRTLHAAIWDSKSAVAGTSAKCSNFSGEGIGKKCWRNLNWSTTAGDYKLRIWRLHKDKKGRWWGFWVISPDGKEYHIGNIRAAKNAKYIKNDSTHDHYNFIENWSHQSYNTCAKVPDARYTVYWPRFNGNQAGAIRRNISETNCVNVRKSSNKTVLEIGF